MKKQSDKSPSTVSFRPSPEVLRQLSELGAVWGENRTQSLVRAIQIAYHVMFPARVPSQKP
jgi:hypothetical protein